MNTAHPLRLPVLGLLTLGALALTSQPSARAASDTWQGSSGTQDWNNPANWAGGNIPGSTSITTTTDDATFNGAAGGASVVTIDANRNIRRVLFTSTTLSYTIGSAGANGGNALLVSNNGIVGINTNVANAVAQTIDAPLIFQGTTAAIWSDSSTVTATMTLNGNISYAGNGSMTLDLRGRNTGANTITGVISDGLGGGTLAINKQGQNTTLWILGGTNTYTGPTTINGGTLRAGSTQAFGVNSEVILGSANAGVTAALALNGHNNTIGSLATTGSALSNGTVTLGAATLTIAGVNASAVDFAGVVSGTGALVKNGAGLQSLSGASTHGGGTTVNAGTLLLASASALQGATGALTVNGGILSSSVADTLVGGSLVIDGGTVSANSAGIGSIILAANQGFTLISGTLQLSFADTISFDRIIGSGAGSQFTLNGGTLDLTNSILDYGASYQIFSGFNSGSVSGSTLTFVNYDTLHWSATLSDAGLLTFAAVPEPATWGLLATMGVFAFTVARRKTRLR